MSTTSPPLGGSIGRHSQAPLVAAIWVFEYSWLGALKGLVRKNIVMPPLLIYLGNTQWTSVATVRVWAQLFTIRIGRQWRTAARSLKAK